MQYCALQCLHHEPDGARSPVLFLHGFPDSPAIFDAYHTPRERALPWLAGRSIHCFAFPNRQTLPGRVPESRALQGDCLWHEFLEAMMALAANSPTSKVVVIAHDHGATYAWRYAREHPQPAIERLVALSVGSSFRFDLLEHGPRALAWLSHVLFSLGYHVRSLRWLVNSMLRAFAGYRGDGDLCEDAYHYWDRLRFHMFFPLRLLGYGYQPPFVDFAFPVLYLRSAADRIASTRRFEAELSARDDCVIQVLRGVNHWFVHQDHARALAPIRDFLSPTDAK